MCGVLFLTLLYNEVFAFISRERQFRNRLWNLPRFFLEYGNRIVDYIVIVFILSVIILSYYFASRPIIEQGQLSDFSGPILVLPLVWFQIVSVLLASELLGKVVYLSIVRLRLKVKYGKDFKN